MEPLLYPIVPKSHKAILTDRDRNRDRSDSFSEGAMCQAKSHDLDVHHSHPHPSQSARPLGSSRQSTVEQAHPTRREVLGRLTAAALATAAGGSPLRSLVHASGADDQPPSGGVAPDRLFDLKQVADGIFGAIAKPTAVLNCNAAVIINRDHVLVVDTHSKPSAARALIQQIRDQITPLPIRYVVDSHL